MADSLTPQASNMSLWDSFKNINWLDNTSIDPVTGVKTVNAGMLPVATNTIGSIMQGWAGLQQLKLAKQQQKFNEQMSAVNLANQASSYNRQTNDLAANRERLNAAKYGTASDYMSKWAAKGTIGG